MAGGHRLERLVVAAVFGLLSAGCSWITVARPPPRPVDAASPLHCTSDEAAPVGDALLGGGAVAVGLLAALNGAWQGTCGTLGGPSTPCPADTGKVAAGLALVAVGVITGSSAITGFQWTAECRELERLQAACLAGGEAACTSLREPPVGPEPAGDPRPPKRPDRGLEAGDYCAADAECRAGLACRLGRCATVQAP